ncbi:tryptophan 2,3-dioxygenase-like [Crassostrea virginica]|uniref:Tryptophan 2,3-dioxygenase-like n=1 Tax=Crassostrea virginica TaxID=6565 RepID=A0A8B8DCC9_CRAVI|nr:tryptophan 2,3-dioxygenase-like [Crassostrea virginica]
MSDVLTYETYLCLDKILDSQHLESEAKGERVDEEHLFIIVHQAFEVWFKQILEDFGGILRIFQMPDFDDRKHLALIMNKLERTSLIFKVVVQHFEIIETMSPSVFLNFRKYLKSGSGFQSLQFRLIENTLGLEPEARSDGKGKDYKKELTDEERVKAQKSERGPTLFSVFEEWLKRVFETCIGNDPTKYLSAIETMVTTWAEDTNLDEHHRADKAAFAKVLKKESYQNIPGNRLSFEAFHGALLISLYQDEPEFQNAYKTVKLVMDVDAAVSKWRHNHVLMVHRMIGKKMGTGGSSGYDYLKSTNQDEYRVFIELFHLGAFLIPKDYKTGPKPYKPPNSGKISSN